MILESSARIRVATSLAATVGRALRTTQGRRRSRGPRLQTPSLGVAAPSKYSSAQASRRRDRVLRTLVTCQPWSHSKLSTNHIEPAPIPAARPVDLGDPGERLRAGPRCYWQQGLDPGTSPPIGRLKSVSRRTIGRGLGPAGYDWGRVDAGVLSAGANLVINHQPVALPCNPQVEVHSAPKKHNVRDPDVGTHQLG